MKLKTTYLLILSLLFASFSAFSQAPVANFNANTVSGCSPLIVDFQDQSTGGVTEWSWDFGNGGISNKQNPSAIYFNPGSYTVTLTVKTASGASNTITKTAFITVVNEPVVNFITDKTSGCSPAVIKFTDQSTTPPGTSITGWKWDFGDGGSSTEKNPTYVYRNPGNYTVSLSITNDKGCTKLITKPNIINVTTGVKPSINFIDPDVCSAPATITFSATGSTGPGTLTYSWRLDNGPITTGPTVTKRYTTNGVYAVTLIVRSNMGCVDSVTRGVTIGKATTDFIEPASICPRTPVQFLNNSTPRPISARWIFSNGTTDNRNNGMTTFQNPGTYRVRLINTYAACIDTLDKTITVLPMPPLSFTASDTAKCQPSLTVNFNNTTSGTNYTWDFGDSAVSSQTNPTHTYNRFGDFDVTLIATGTNGCTDTLVKPAFIKIRKPAISFAGLPAVNCVPFTFNFKANIDGVDSAVSYNWNFGDGSANSNLATPSHTYSNQGTYAVSLTITTSSGCTETFTLPNAIKVGTIPKPDFVADITNACGYPGIQFTNLSTGATEYMWTFSDGSFSTEENPMHVFTDTGWVSVTLAAINNGCEELLTKDNYVYIRPSISKFDYQPDCNNKLLYTFTDRSIGATSWDWEFGDGTTYSGQTPPVHAYPSDGTYVVSLTTSNGTCTYKHSRTVIVKDNFPDFNATVREGCKSFRPTVRAAITNPAFITQYLWDFGDGIERDGGPSGNASFTYTEAGNYNVTLTTVDTFGCRHSITKNNFIRVNGPEPYFTSVNSNGCKGMIASFTDSTITDGVNPIVNWKWDFGDGTIQSFNNAPFEHQYDSIGDYDVKMVVTDAAGCKDSITSREFVKVSILKNDWKSDTETCPNAIISFFDNTLSDLPFTSLWDFGDGNTSTSKHTSHRYTDTGTYTVKLFVKDLVGCEDSLIKTNAVRVGLPVASFTANNFDTYCLPFQGIFQNTSSFSKSYNWNLSIATSTQQNPSIYYTDPGVYPITLEVTSPGGCKDTAIDTLIVHDVNEAKITYTPLLGCRPLLVDFEAFTEMNARFIWDFGDGNVVDTTVNKYTHLYDNFGAFVPKIILKEPEGCLITLTGTETITINGAKAKFDIAQLLFCDSGSINILDSTTSRDRITRYTWNFGDGTISNSIVPVHNYTSPGIYPVSLLVETETGCKDSMTYRVPVKVVQSPLIAVTGDSVICVNEKLNVNGIFLRPDTSSVSWSWQFGNGNGSGSQNPDPQQYSSGDYTIYSVATNSSGCQDSVMWNVKVNPLPEIYVTTPLTKIVGIPISIPVTYSNNIQTYSWLPANGLSCTDCPQPITDTKFSTDYVISVVDSNRCLNAEQVRVIVLCKGAEIFIPNTFSPNGDGRNDFFYPRGRGIERIRTLRIFNRWGEVVFENREFPINDQLAGWDGKYKNGAPQAGVYVYQAELICENGEILTYKGNIALIL